MDIQLAESYESIPDDKKIELQNANPFFQESSYNYYLSLGKKMVYFYDDELIMPIVISDKIIFKYGYLPSEPYVLKKEYNNSEKIFLDSVMEKCKTELKLDWIGQTPPWALFKDAPSDSISIPFGSHVIDLELSEEELWANVHSKHRNVIRKAEKCDVKVSSGGIELLKDYLIAEKDTMERSELSAGTEETYLTDFKQFGDQVKIFLAKYEDTIEGGAIIVVSDAMAYYMHGASINSPLTGAMNLVQWDIIKYLKSIGVKKYSFVGCRINEDKDSKYHGIQNFKKRFGGELVEGRMFKILFKPYKYRLYRTLIKIKTKGAISEDIIDQEIHKWQ